MAGDSEPRKAVSCPNCGDALPARALGLAVNTACVSCGAVVDTVEQRNAVLYLQNLLKDRRPLIPLGTRGKREGHEWEVIGWQVREDVDSGYRWEEYLLFNPRYGYRWLTLADGHWNWVRGVYGRMHPDQQKNSKEFRWEGQNYSLYHKGKARTVLVLGEFYWRLRKGYTVSVRDYVCPPKQISLEIDETEISCSVSEYLTKREVEAMFGLQSLPVRANGVAPNQPRPFPGMWPVLMTFLAIAAALLVTQLAYVGAKQPVQVAASEPILIYPATAANTPTEYQAILQGYTASAFLSGFSKVERLISVDSFRVEPDRLRARFDETGQHLIVPEVSIGPFKTERTDNLVIECKSSLNNNWMGLEFVLFNAKTQEARFFNLDFEYYSGTDSDGSWTEGNKTGEVVVSALEPGEWSLSVSGVAGSSQPEPILLQVRALSGVPDWLNFALAMVIVAACALVWIFASYNFEYRRWSGSDYNPYVSE